MDIKAKLKRSFRQFIKKQDRLMQPWIIIFKKAVESETDVGAEGSESDLEGSDSSSDDGLPNQTLTNPFSNNYSLKKTVSYFETEVFK